MKTTTIFFVISLMLSVKAATITSSSVDYDTVNSLVVSANSGDVIQLPAGTSGWYQSLILNGVSLIGAGTNSTIITDETPVGASRPLIIINTLANFQTRVSAIKFTSGTTNNISTYPNNSGGNITVNGSTPNWRIDNCQFVLLSGKTIRQTGDVYGLLDHCNFEGNSRIFMEIFGAGYGDADWASQITFGSSNATYIENCYFKDDNDDGWVDVSAGGRVVVRYCQGDGFFMNTHGTESPGRFRSVRYFEFYMNTISHPGLLSPGSYNNFYTGVDIRGGTALIFSNNFTAVNAATIIRDYRATDNSPFFFPFNGATGTNGFDNNGSQLLSGSAAGTTNVSYLTVTGATWTVNQYVGATVFNVVSNKHGIVTHNTGNTISFLQSDVGGQAAYLVGFKNGDTFSIHLIYPMIDGCGIGRGDLLAGDTPTPVNLNQASEPIYSWGNNRTRQENGFLITYSADIVNNYPSILAGRQYTNTPAPGYVPFTYPFPSSQGGGGDDTFQPITGKRCP